MAAKGRTNIELREQFILAEGVSQSMTAFKPKASPGAGSAGPQRTQSVAGPITKVCLACPWSSVLVPWCIVRWSASDILCLVLDDTDIFIKDDCYSAPAVIISDHWKTELVYVYIYMHTHAHTHDSFPQLTLLHSVNCSVFQSVEFWKDVFYWRPVCTQYSWWVSSSFYCVFTHPQKYILSLLLFPFVVNFFHFPANLINICYSFCWKSHRLSTEICQFLQQATLWMYVYRWVLNICLLFVTAGFCQGVNEIFTVLGFHAVTFGS